MVDTELERRLTELGGLSSLGEVRPLGEKDKRYFIETKKMSQSSDFFNFIVNYGGRVFNESVLFNGMEDIILFPQGQIPLSLFLGFVEGPFGIAEIASLIEDNIPSGYVPFGMGDPTGDYWVYHIESGGVYFWKHDEPEGEDTFPAASSIKDFIMKCSIEEGRSTNKADAEIVDYQISDEL